jgi:ABC-2 type transport system permease protein
MTTTTAVPSHDGLRAALADTWTMAGRSIRLSRRNTETLVMAMLLPLMMMSLFVYVLGGAIQTGTAEYINYVVPGILLLCTGYGAASTAMAVADDMTTGMIDRLRSLPIHAGAVLTGHVVASVARNAVSTTLVLGAAMLMGFDPVAGPLDWTMTALLLLGYVSALSWLAAGLGAVSRTVESASAFSFVMLFLPYLSSAFVPIDSMPAALAVVGQHQPITPVIETVRGLLTGTNVGSSAVTATLWVLGLLVCSVALAVLLFRRRTLREG